ncbi:transcription initiation protein spt4 [Auricularia subglabra TFB-10046 SS5]|nr:transcription initiation protein spt4 [Auricularia subglabra TFB-10046 SS5]
MADSVPSTKTKGLRACLLCSVIQTVGEFKRKGCPNCENILQMQNSTDRVSTCTSKFFTGIIAVMNPDQSWVARWQRTAKFVPGMYAIQVNGRLPEDVEDELVQQGMTYRPRDGSMDDKLN